MATTNLAAWLKKSKTKWAETAAATKEKGLSTYERLPDGKYVARVTSVEVGTSDSGRNQIKWGHTIAEGEFRGEKVYAYDGLDHEDSLEWLSKKVLRFNVDPTEIDIENLQVELDALISDKPAFKIRLKTKKDSDYQDVYLDSIIEDYEDPEGEDEGEPEPEPEKKPEPKKPAAKPDKPAKKKPEPEPEPELEGLEEEIVIEDDEDVVVEDELEIAVGMPVKFTWKGETLEGEIKEIDEEAAKCKVKVGKMVYPVKFDQLVATDTAKG